MAGSTTNLGLTKPTYSEDADIAVINTNMDTLDSKIGAVGSTSLQAQITSANEAMSTYTISSNTLANVESALATFGATLGENEIRKIRFNISTASGVFASQGYMGTIKRYAQSDRYVVEVQNTVYTGDGEIITGTYYNNAWKWRAIYQDVARFQGIEIASETDIDSLTTPGNYYSPNSARSATLVHAPFSDSGFSLKVVKRYGFVDQEAQYSNVIRIRGSSSTGFTDWKDVTTESNIHNMIKTKATSSKSFTTNSSGMVQITGSDLPTMDGFTRITTFLGNFTSSDFSASQIPPTIVQTASGSVFLLGSPSKTYNGIVLIGLFVTN